MKRLLASNLLPQRAGQPVKALVHMTFADLCDLDVDSKLQDAWVAGYRARWAARRAAASVSTGDGGAWLAGDTARAIAADAMIIPVVTADIDPGAIDQLIGLCVEYDRLRGHAAAGPGQDPAQATAGAGDSTVVPAGAGDSPAARDAGQDAGQADRLAQVLAMLEHQILATVLQIVSGPGGVASFLRRNLLGKGLNGPSLPFPAARCRPDRRHPRAPAAPGRTAGPDVPVPRRILPLYTLRHGIGVVYPSCLSQYHNSAEATRGHWDAAQLGCWSTGPDTGFGVLRTLAARHAQYAASWFRGRIVPSP